MVPCLLKKRVFWLEGLVLSNLAETTDPARYICLKSQTRLARGHELSKGKCCGRQVISWVPVHLGNSPSDVQSKFAKVFPSQSCFVKR